jgi:hypothetical protein
MLRLAVWRHGKPACLLSARSKRRRATGQPPGCGLFWMGDFWMKRLLAIVFLANGLSLPAASAAEPLTIRTNTAGELAETCAATPRQPGADAKINFCHGFAQGAITVELRHAGEKKPFCFPTPSPSRAATMGEFVNWVRALPDRKSMPSTEAFFQFLAERYPCK